MMNSLVGVDYKKVVVPLKVNERIRVIKPNSVITNNFDTNRINIVIGDDDLIVRIYRG